VDTKTINLKEENIIFEDFVLSNVDYIFFSEKYIELPKRITIVFVQFIFI